MVPGLSGLWGHRALGGIKETRESGQVRSHGCHARPPWDWVMVQVLCAGPLCTPGTLKRKAYMPGAPVLHLPLEKWPSSSISMSKPQGQLGTWGQERQGQDE